MLISKTNNPYSDGPKIRPKIAWLIVPKAFPRTDPVRIITLPFKIDLKSEIEILLLLFTIIFENSLA